MKVAPFALKSCLLLAALAAAPGARALVGGAGADQNTAASPWAGVGSLSTGGGQFTGTLIAPGYLLTAAHVVNGVDPASISFRLNSENSFASGASQVFINPAYGGTPTHGDLAIVKLSGAVKPGAAPIYDVFGGSVQGRELALVSHANSTSIRKTGANMADMVLTDPGGKPQTYLFDFDGPTLDSNRIGDNIVANGTLGAAREASLVAGDSGSAAFVQAFVNGQWRWQLAGINTFEVTFREGPTTSGAFGTGGGGIVLSSYASWINAVISPTPEPGSYLMLLLGLGLVGSVARRR